MRTSLLIIMIAVANFAFAAPQYVTYDFSGGRLGDCLITYLHAKWLAYEKGVPLLYKPFEYSSFLVLHDRELRKVQTASKNIYKCPYFPESTWEMKNHPFSGFAVDWKDPEFRTIVRELIAPKGKLDLIRPPENVRGVALHVREGGGYDVNGFAYFPTKFPPLSFYIDGVKAALAQFPGEHLYCQLFTDALDPAALITKIRQELPPDASIEFHYRDNNNVHDANVLEDFFSLFEFDILIRPASNFSIVPSLICDYAMVYAAEDYDAEQGRVVVKMELAP